MVAPPVDEIVAVVAAWARAEENIRAPALVGSHARDMARTDFDIDFMALVEDFRADRDRMESSDRVKTLFKSNS
jgi:hypothetical protein